MEMQRCNNCEEVFEESLQECPKCGRDDCLMYPFEPSAKDIMEKFADGRTGWSEDSQLEICLDFIEKFADLKEFENYLQRQADMEMTMGD